MKLISKKQYYISEIIKTTEKYYHRDVVELNEILFKYKYFETVGMSWEQYLKKSSLNKLNNLYKDIKKSNL